MKRGEDRTADTDDDRGVVRAILPWASVMTSVTTGSSSYGRVERQPGGAWQLAIAVCRPTRRQVFFIDVDPDGIRTDRWHLLRLGPGVWEVTPSLHVDGQIHTFITLVGVPEPAPWKKEADRG